MKKKLLLITFLTFSIGIFAQTFEVDSAAQSKIKGYQIKLVSKNKKSMFDVSMTKIEYKNMLQLLDDTKKMSIRQMWTKDKTEKKLTDCQKQCSGGEVILKVNRGTLTAGNMGMFSVIIQDESGNELYRNDFSKGIPNFSTAGYAPGYYYNVGVLCIDRQIPSSFYVFIIDKLGESPYKFEVTAIYKK